MGKGPLACWLLIGTVQHATSSQHWFGTAQHFRWFHMRKCIIVKGLADGSDTWRVRWMGGVDVGTIGRCIGYTNT